MSFLNKLFRGAKPLADIVAGNNGIVSLLKETSKPTSKLSSKKSAASLLLITGVTMATGELDTNKMILIGLFVGCGTLLLWASAHYHRKD